jgi:hypothetical protein
MSEHDNGLKKSLAVIGVLHTAPGLCAVITNELRLAGLALDPIHLVDEGLLRMAARSGTTPELVDRLATQCGYLVASGAAGVLVSCSSLGTAVAELRPHVGFRLFRIDEPMAKQAIAVGGRVGVAATIVSTLAPTVALLEATAAASGTRIEVIPQLCNGAFDALREGRLDEHDRHVEAVLESLAASCDVIVLAQASMRRVLEARGPSYLAELPVLSSPTSGVRQLAPFASELARRGASKP